MVLVGHLGQVGQKDRPEAAPDQLACHGEGDLGPIRTVGEVGAVTDDVVLVAAGGDESVVGGIVDIHSEGGGPLGTGRGGKETETSRLGAEFVKKGDQGVLVVGPYRPDPQGRSVLQGDIGRAVIGVSDAHRGDPIQRPSPQRRRPVNPRSGKMGTMIRRIAALAAPVLTLAGVLLYFRSLRQPILTWGATYAEAASSLPGDELLPEADGTSTRAISIAAPPEAVWPWLAQMGPSPRGGVYTYDWIENLLGLNIHSVDRVLPEYQDPQVGDSIPLGDNRMVISRIDPGEVFAFCSDDGNWVWTFVLRAEDGGTRLISRNRFRLPTLGARIGILPMEPGSLVMERKMLHGIRERAEGLVAAGSGSVGRIGERPA